MTARHRHVAACDAAKPMVVLFPKADAALRAVGKWGYPDRALHCAHRRFFHRHGLIEIHSPGRVRTTAKADALLSTGAP